jgi:hypothetical protein
MQTRMHKPSRKVLETLLSSVKILMSTFIGNPHFGKSYAVNLNTAYDEFEVLAGKISVELELQDVVKTAL